MAGKSGRGNPVAVSDLTSAILDPVLRKRAGISIGLIQSWDEIAGRRLAGHTRPEKIVWPRRMHEDDPFQPATLVIACEGFAALQVQHETGEIIGKVNSFLGFNAIGRIKIVQKPVKPERPPEKPGPRALSASEAANLAKAVGGVEDEDLRGALERLGRSVIGRANRE